MENKKFNEMLEKFYNNGLLKEVYTTDKTKVCNAFNQFYVVFNLEMQEDFTNQFPGFKIGTSSLKKLIADDGYIFDYYNALTPEMQKKIVLPLDQQLFDFWMANKQEFSMKPPNPKLDLVYEQQVIAEQQRKQELGQMMAENASSNVIVHQNATQK